MKINNFGVLYVVATPIGNLKDISLRAVEVLQNVACIAAEDTRHSLPLLQHFAIKTPMLAFHEHNERANTKKLIEKLKQGESIALISDAGTPLLSDPGFFLVHEARIAGIQVSPVPGPCAAIAALSVAGLPTDRFVFEGFLPAKSKQRRQRLEELRNEIRTLIFYEAPHRILDLMDDLINVLGEERSVVIARELTKRFETIHSGHLSELKKIIESDTNQQRGEIVVLIQGAKKSLEEKQIATEEILSVLLEELPLKQAVEIAAKITGERKNILYKQALKVEQR
jgi:16S rRNA (cytidine1402-2'-O)-methyltransferase